MTSGIIGERSFWLLCSTETNGTMLERNFQVGVNVLLKDSTTHNYWPMAEIIKAYKGSNGHVQTVEIGVGESTFNNEKLPTTLVRPTQKIQLLVENHMVQFPDKEAVACNDQDDASSRGEPCITCCKSCEL